MKKACLPILLIAFLASCKTHDNNSPKRDMIFAPANTKSVKLPVKVLPTVDGALEEGEANDFKYPTGMSLYGLNNIDEVAAYGAAYQLWLGPKGWTGNGLSAANGGVRVELYPEGGEKLQGAYITYVQEPSCQGCILDQAARYFPKARKEYNAQFDDGSNEEPVKIKGMVIHKVSERLVTFTLPAPDGFVKKGVACYIDAPDKYFTEATFVLPADKAGIIDLLQKQFIATLPK